MTGKDKQNHISQKSKSYEISSADPYADVTYQTVNLFSFDKCFMNFISDVPHYIWWNQHNTAFASLLKAHVLDTFRAMICLYFGIAFLLFWWGPGIYYSCMLLVYPIIHILDVKKSSNLIKGISSHNICSGVKSQQVKKPFVIQYQKLLIFLRIPLFHFIESLSTIKFHVSFW